MNIQELQNKHLEVIKVQSNAEDFDAVTSGYVLYNDNFEEVAKDCTKITLQAIVDELTTINNRNKHQKFSEGYNSDIENEIERFTKEIKLL